MAGSGKYIFYIIIIIERRVCMYVYVYIYLM